MPHIGAGHNPLYVKQRGSLPPGVSLVEGGVDELGYWQGDYSPERLSLHLARTPITEDRETQAAFVRALRGAVGEQNFCSIGLHVTGPRTSGIGRYGFSSHFDPSARAEGAATDFLRDIQDAFDCPTWVENANFYSGSASEVLRVAHSINRIAAASGSKLIVDITHAHIDAANVGLSTDCVLGAIEWPMATEIHLAGLAIGRDGTLHDGHSFPIPEEIWESAESCLRAGFLDEEITITIEHTDLDWEDRLADLHADFRRLTDLIQRATPAQAQHYDLDRIAQQYVQKMLTKAIPNLSSSFQEACVDLKATVRGWLEARLSNPSFSLVVGRKEVGFHAPGNQVAFYADDFLKYLEEEGIMDAD